MRYDYGATGIEKHTVHSPLALRDGKATLAMGATGSKTAYNVAYTVYPDGSLDMKVTFDPQRRGLPTGRREELYGGDTPEKAMAVFDGVLENRATRSQKECVVINAAFAIQAAEPTFSVEACIARARESLDSGAALWCFRRFVELNR